VAGVSVGGLIAQGFALSHPERLTALVLCDTAPKLGEPQMWNDRIAAIRARGMGAIADAVMERWFSAGFRQNRPVDLAGWRNLFLRTDVGGYCGTCATLRDSDLTAEIGGIGRPTLVLVGDEDGSTPVPLVRACAEGIPGARFEVIPRAGHIPSIEQPAAIAALLTEFFEEAGHG
jgi:3-oxoadipate enol-lactonase